MAKYIVREIDTGEFYCSINAKNFGELNEQLMKRGLTSDNFLVTLAPVAEMFANPNWETDFNNRMSSYHY
jgi:hypothetical protein